jgi:AraC-like DNA-binding protein
MRDVAANETKALLERLDPVAGLIRRHAPNEGIAQTNLPAVGLIRSNRPTLLRGGILRPSVCVVVQGGKKIHLGKESIGYGPGSYLASTIDMPAAGHVTAASSARPYLSITFDLPPGEIASVLTEAQLPVEESSSQASRAAFVGRADAHLLDVIHRVLSLLDRPQDAVFLGPHLKRELIYRLLTGPDGAYFRRNVLLDRHALGISRTLDWLKTNFKRPLKIEQLAKVGSMSVSSLHHRFKAVTTMGPLQYQKRLRLEEARRLLLSGAADATSAAFDVGYESPSQFNREYRRLFGLPPLQDLKMMRREGVPSPL